MNQANLLQKEATLTQTQFDVHAYTLNLGLWPSTQLLEGSVIIEGTSLVNSLSHLEIDLLSNMTVDSVIQDQNAVNYTHTGDIVHIQLPVPI
ncbi:MAG: hypothetical protein GWN00_34005, partial [Aliifodinibius sp.]|nr:M1 family metallopeptidase [Fodinibius sp.]NIV16688.1 hypothetical protein [Fodinibius sp.]NIY29621.1 hypothetical protein [Fodinibius sp.]